MFYYKSEETGDVFAYDEALDLTGMESLVEISEEDAKKFSEEYVDPLFTGPRVERKWRDCELRRADVELSKVQDSDPNAKGTVGDWREYRKQLRAWPSSKDFPNQAFRPKAPDVK